MWQWIKKNYKNAVILLLGNFLVAFSTNTFLNYKHGDFEKMLSGGLGGFSLIANVFFKLDNPEIIANIMMWVLFILGLVCLGKKFALQTILSAVLFSVFTLYVFNFPIFTQIQNSFNELDPILMAFIGGVLVGTGCGIIYRIGGSTGGFDIPPLVITKYCKKIKLSTVFFLQDGVLVVCALIAGYSLNQVVVGLISVFACSMAVGATQAAGQQSYIADIISEKYEEINKAILEKLDRGSTIFECVGGYTGKERKMIKVMIGKKQYHTLLELVKNIDPNAFMSLQSSSDIFGIGFREYER